MRGINDTLSSTGIVQTWRCVGHQTRENGHRSVTCHLREGMRGVRATERWCELVSSVSRVQPLGGKTMKSAQAMESAQKQIQGDKAFAARMAFA